MQQTPITELARGTTINCAIPCGLCAKTNFVINIISVKIVWEITIGDAIDKLPKNVDCVNTEKK